MVSRSGWTRLSVVGTSFCMKSIVSVDHQHSISGTLTLSSFQLRMFATLVLFTLHPKISTSSTSSWKMTLPTLNRQVFNLASWITNSPKRPTSHATESSSRSYSTSHLFQKRGGVAKYTAGVDTTDGGKALERYGFSRPLMYFADRFSCWSVHQRRWLL